MVYVTNRINCLVNITTQLLIFFSAFFPSIFSLLSNCIHSPPLEFSLIFALRKISIASKYLWTYPLNLKYYTNFFNFFQPDNLYFLSFYIFSSRRRAMQVVEFVDSACKLQKLFTNLFNSWLISSSCSGYKNNEIYDLLWLSHMSLVANGGWQSQLLW